MGCRKCLKGPSVANYSKSDGMLIKMRILKK